jgi:hypothetical protein
LSPSVALRRLASPMIHCLDQNNSTADHNALGWGQSEVVYEMKDEGAGRQKVEKC